MRYWTTKSVQLYFDRNIHLDTLETQIFLWLSALKLAKKFNSTSFNLKQEVFIRRDEERPEEGWYLWGRGRDTYFDQRWTVKVNLHTFCGWLIDLWSVSCVECGRLLQLSLDVWTYYHTCCGECGDEGMTLLNLRQVIKSLALFGNYVANNSIDMGVNWTGF